MDRKLIFAGLLLLFGSTHPESSAINCDHLETDSVYHKFTVTVHILRYRRHRRYRFRVVMI